MHFAPAGAKHEVIVQGPCSVCPCKVLGSSWPCPHFFFVYNWLDSFLCSTLSVFTSSMHTVVMQGPLAEFTCAAAFVHMSLPCQSPLTAMLVLQHAHPSESDDDDDQTTTRPQHSISACIPPEARVVCVGWGCVGWGWDMPGLG